MRVRRRLLPLAAAFAGLVVVPGVAVAATPHAAVVSQNAADYTPQLESTLTVLKPSVDGIAVSPVSGLTFAGGKFTKVAGVNESFTNLVAFNTSTGAVKETFRPQLNNLVRDVEDAPDGGVYVGGDFTTVNGVTSPRLVKFTADGTLDPRFKATSIKGIVHDVDLEGNHLIVAGAFGKKLVSLNPDTGADDGLINQSVTGEACLPSGACSWGNTAVYDVATENGRLVAVGNFAAPRSKLFVLNLDLAANRSSLSPWYYQSFAKPCASTNTRRIAYLQGVDWNPSGTAFNVTATGQIPKFKTEIWQQGAGDQLGATVCDAVGRFVVDSSTPKAQWINYTGGDSVWEVADTGAAVYIQGHFRWVDNPNGTGSTCPDADLATCDRRSGIAAIDPQTGQALSWSPAVPTQTGGRALEATPQGLWVGTDSAKFGAEQHYGIAFAPLR